MKSNVKIPTARQLPSGNWFVQLRIDGRSISITKPTQREAVAEALAIKEGIIKAKNTPRNAITLKAAMEDYISQRENVLSPATIAGYHVIRRNRFQQHYLPEQEIQKQNTKKLSGRPWLRRIAACAAIVILILCIPLSSRALSLEELWDIVARWAKETFSFVSGDIEHFSEPSPAYDGEYSSLQDVLRANNRDTSLVPTWIPDGYELDSVEKVISPEQELYLAHYISSEGYFILRTQTFISKKPQNIEIGDDVTEKYSIGSIDYYIFSNENQLQVIWSNAEVEYSISGDISVDIAKEMINSIGKE